MAQSNIQKILQTTKEANSILRNAGGAMIISSFNTAKQIAGLYKVAGFKALNLSKDVITKTAKLAINNQKEIIKTSRRVVKEVVQSVRENTETEELKTMTKEGLNKIGKKKKTVRKRKEMTIDDMI